MNKNKMVLTIAIMATIGFLMPELAHAGLESSLMGIKSKLTGVILPLLSVIGIAIAGTSFCRRRSELGPETTIWKSHGPLS